MRELNQIAGLEGDLRSDLTLVESLRLVKAFIRIPNPGQRSILIDLAEMMAGPDMRQ